MGGFAALAEQLADERRDAAASLLLDGGDFMTGDPVCDLAIDGVRGAALVDMMNLVGYDVGLIGNHEFDNGRANARALAARARFPVLAADILDESGEPEFAAGPVVLERGGLRVGVIGVSCEDLFAVTADVRTAGLTLLDQARLVRRQAAWLDPGTDLLVLLTHNGVQGDTLLARRLAGSGVDLIVGAHSHTRLREPLAIGDILVVQAGSNLTSLGRLDLAVADDRIVSYRGRLITLMAEGREGPPALKSLIDDCRERVTAEFGGEIGRLVRDWRRDSRDESNVGNWLADVMRDAAGADVGLINSGTIRRNLQAGPVTALDVHRLLPFGNTVVRFALTGDELRDVAGENARAAVGGRHGILQVSGLAYRFRREGDEAVLESVTVGGQPLEPGRVYTVACPDFVAQKADVYLGGLTPAPEDAGVTVTEAVLRAVAAAGEIDARIEGRIIEIDTADAAGRE